MLKTSNQLNLFSGTEAHAEEIELSDEIKNWGTFKDSLREPVHRWFTYPAGFSYKAVIHSIKRFGINSNMTVYDPFMGSGTTNVTCKSMGISSCGVEAHPFVYKITEAKMEWDIDLSEARKFIQAVENNFMCYIDKIINIGDFALENAFPELVLKCYPAETLEKLHVLKTVLQSENLSKPVFNFFYVVITALIREVSSAATGWPYIAPKKIKVTSSGKNVLEEFVKLSYKMLEDLININQNSSINYKNSTHRFFNADSRDTTNLFKDESIDHVFTSPPYLNNFDYSDRTRLELYFWGDAKSWKDISDGVRTKLITSATTQVSRSESKYILLDAFKYDCPIVTEFIQVSANQLNDLRKTKGGKKNYDLMVIGYFNDMYKILKDVYRVLKPKTKALFILGDSAPYGIHIPTDRLIGEIGVCIGFSSYTMEVLRKRGEKWKGNPQRHNISLQESIIILEKN